MKSLADHQLDQVIKINITSSKTDGQSVPPLVLRRVSIVSAVFPARMHGLSDEETSDGPRWRVILKNEIYL